MMMKMTMTGLCRLCILLMHLFEKLLVRPWPDQPDRVLRLCAMKERKGVWGHSNAPVEYAVKERKGVWHRPRKHGVKGVL